MPTAVPLQPSHFYDAMPINDNRPGDVWTKLPTFGIFPNEVIRGVVITPACDLANKKCETITYLPIISVNDYLGSSAFRYDCWLEIQPLLSKLAGYKEMPEPDRYDLLPIEYLGFADGAISDATGKKLSTDELSRLAGYINYVKHGHQGTANAAHLAKFIKADKMKSFLSRLITNALRADIHFLPADGLPVSYSAITHHSVVMFRYPMSIQIELLCRAQNLTEADWQNYVKSNISKLPVLNHIRQWPIKFATLRSEFYADMISRYINMYIRLGSTDFEDQTVRDFSEQIKDGK